MLFDCFERLFSLSSLFPLSPQKERNSSRRSIEKSLTIEIALTLDFATGSICSTKLTLNTYKLPFEGATLYCAKCLPQDRPTITTDNVDFVNARERPKIGVVNEQVRGELAGQKPNESVDSLAIANRVNAPKAGLVNDQVRGELAGVKPNESTDSLAISNRVNAPRQEVVNQQLR
ncbi:hypothetical protein CAOG_01691 [Capsaspora owczarzaki ATCC 30864]|uniref:hypothetical protein n=1 Tax=Capsaspora owczarzaki (strain ATCC 30864) TaxID=595528 RepID=UPI0001FE29B6|nr:hypothetical protein CAOG_01691 [Capsaspora owczarzaki ATCC 30864]|eukprot:XP_004364559.1 hypothetical protein CAOG_01691 [Capsaspora owczarzaki ATCC 30864]